MSQGEVFIDNRNIGNEAELWRRIHRDWWKFDENMNVIRPTSQAFQNYAKTKKMSVCIADLIRESGRNAEDILTAFEDYALASITAGIARECNQVIIHQPENEEPAHAHVCGEKPSAIRKRLAKASTWVIEPHT